MSYVSRGFRGRRPADVDPVRIPPGQYVTADFPSCPPGRRRTRRWSRGTFPSSASWTSRAAGPGVSSGAPASWAAFARMFRNPR